MAVKCIICMDSGYLAIHKDKPFKIVPMLDLLGSDLSDYNLKRCSCMEKSTAAKWKAQADAIKNEQLRL
jgi:hypothetical protein